MSGNTATDGQDPGQVDDSTETGTAGGDTASGDGDKDTVRGLKAEIEMLRDSVSEMRNAVLASRQPGASPQETEVEINDDEPLTASKLKKIVDSSVAKAANANQTLSQRDQWDNKAKADFPLVDPEFQLAVRKEWREQVASGLNGNHPKALYNVAQIVARTWKGTKKPATRDAETAHTSEASTQRQATHQTGRRAATVSDDDPRVKFYAMKGTRTTKQIEELKKKLGERDAAAKGARR